MITGNVFSQPESEVSYQKVQEIDAIEVLLHIDSKDYIDILEDVGDDDNVVDTILLSQYDLEESSEDTNMSSNSEESKNNFIERDFT